MTKLHQVHSNAEVVTGEVGHPQVISELWKKSEHAAMMSAGYSCQPFSQLGDQRGDVTLVLKRFRMCSELHFSCRFVFWS